MIPRSLVLLVALTVPTAAALAQVPAPPDTARRDTSQVTRLPEIEVSVTRSPEPLARVPNAVGVLDRTDLQRAQLTVGLDEAFNNLPGVVVSNRYNFSLDSGSRFGGSAAAPTSVSAG